MSEDADNPHDNPPDLQSSGAKGGAETGLDFGELEEKLADRKVQRTALIQIEKQLRHGMFSADEQRQLRELCLRWLNDPRCGKRSKPRYLSIAARLEANDVAKTKLALDAVAEAKQQGDIHVHGSGGQVQVNITQQISELRKAATIDERLAILQRLEGGNGNGKH